MPVYPVGSGKANVALISYLRGTPNPALNPSSSLHHSNSTHGSSARLVNSATLGKELIPSTKMLQLRVLQRTLCKRKRSQQVVRSLTNEAKRNESLARLQGRPRDTPYNPFHAPLHDSTQPYVNYCVRRPQQGNNWIQGRLDNPHRHRFHLSTRTTTTRKVRRNRREKARATQQTTRFSDC
jgi:hypothetical protein